MRKWLLLVVLEVATSSLLVAQSDPVLGMWKLNLAKSKYDPGPPPKSLTVKVEPVPNGVKQVTDAVDAQGKSAHSEPVFTFDGKEHPAATE
jgi:hypothetical protein